MKEIPLTQGKVALVDDEDYEELSKYKWRAHRGAKTFYAVRWRRREEDARDVVGMHRIITGLKGSDHIDNDGLNNQRYNLRSATRSQQNCNQGIKSNNRSGFKGVCWNKKCKKWSAYIRKDYKGMYLGLYRTPEEAYAAYCQAAIKYHREFANTGEQVNG